jgi:hypothetical protein
VVLTNRRDVSFFIKIISLGTAFVGLLILSIVSIGIFAFTNTDFRMKSTNLEVEEIKIDP